MEKNIHIYLFCVAHRDIEDTKQTARIRSAAPASWAKQPQEEQERTGPTAKPDPDSTTAAQARDPKATVSIQETA